MSEEIAVPPVEEAPVEEAPVEEAPVEEAPVEEALTALPVEEAPTAPPVKPELSFVERAEHEALKFAFIHLCQVLDAHFGNPFTDELADIIKQDCPRVSEYLSRIGK